MLRLLAFVLVFGVGVLEVKAQTSQLSAYDALRTVGKAKGDAVLNQFLEMRGREGAPQPTQWILTFKDVAARGGIREYTVTSKGVTAERAPVQGGDLALLGAMGASGLNLDSVGVFDATNKEAAKARLGFETLNYRLQNRNGAPIWSVQLYDVNGNEVGMIEFSAKSGAIVTPLRTASAAATTSTTTNTNIGAVKPKPSPVKTVSSVGTSPALQNTQGNAEGDEASFGERWAEGGGLFGHVGRWSQRAWQTTTNSTKKAGDSVKVFFVGRDE